MIKMSFKMFCNECLCLHSEAKCKFWVTSCFHVFCEICYADKESCRICDNPCRSILINRDLPADVRAFFEAGSVERLGKKLQEIANFHKGQVSLFIEKNQYKKRYQGNKEEWSELQQQKSELAENLKQENAIVERLKIAYRTNNITEDLFTMSPKVTSSTSRGASSSISPMLYHRPGSSASKIPRRPSTRFSPAPHDTPTNITSEMKNLGSQFPNSNGDSTIQRRSSIKSLPEYQQRESQFRSQQETVEKGGIIQKTFQNIQKVSHKKYQTSRREQMRHFSL